ncbi:unnamed protein product [Caenorhabditis nigoni]
MIHFPGGLHKPLSSPNDDQSIVGAIYLVMLVLWCLTLGIFVCANKCKKMKPKRSNRLQRPGTEMPEEFNAAESEVVILERGHIDQIGHVASKISQE